MLEKVIKRDGSIELFDASKVNKWMQWASQELKERVDWPSIVMHAAKISPPSSTSQDFQLALIKGCVEKRQWSYNLMAGRLYAVWHWKKMFGDNIPTLKEQHAKMASLGLMKVLNYSDEEYQIFESVIDHKLDLTLAHSQIKQDIYKYALTNRVENIQYETPQFIFMRMAMALAENHDPYTRIEDAVKWYTLLAHSKLNAPTPNFTNLGTNHSGFASCCLYMANDNARSLAVGDHIAYTMTVMSAGIGGFINTRSKGDPIRGGAVEHRGKLPYFQAVAKAVRANMQGGRGGAGTQYVSVFDPEIEAVIMLQNPRTPIAIQNRDLHFAIMYNSFFAKKVGNKERYFTFNSFTAPDLHAKFFSEDREGFAELYAKYENDPTFTKNYLDAYKLCALMESQAHEQSTLYSVDIEEMNRHTPFLEPIHSSNLCVASTTEILTDKGYQVIKELHNKEVNVWNGQEWSPVVVKKTGVMVSMWKVITEQGNRLDCTAYHKWYVYDKENNVIEKRTLELDVGDRVIKFATPDIATDGKFTVLPEDESFVIQSVEYAEYEDDTYCFTEYKRGMGVFNGILTGQCTEIMQVTKGYDHILDLYKQNHDRGEISLCNLGGVVVPRIKNDEEYFEACYFALKMADTTIDIGSYEFPHLEYTAKQRRNAGIGMLGLAEYFAARGIKIDSPYGLQVTHELAERHMYFMIKASLQLGKEYGNAPWIHKTKWPKGWLPIDTYKKNVDKLTPHVLKYDWETLRKEIIENGGIRNSSLVAHPPNESSSKASGSSNGVYLIRELSLIKTDLGMAIDWCAPNNDIYADTYQLAKEVDTIDMIKYYAVIQKFTDQGISPDFYMDRIKNPTLTFDTLVSHFLARVRYGLKSKYYQHSITPETDGLDNQVIAGDCASGACSL